MKYILGGYSLILKLQDAKTVFQDQRIPYPAIGKTRRMHSMTCCDCSLIYWLRIVLADGHTVAENTGSLLTSEVKRHRARLVLGWGTAWEDLRVLSAFPSSRQKKPAKKTDVLRARARSTGT